MYMTQITVLTSSYEWFSSLYRKDMKVGRVKLREGERERGREGEREGEREGGREGEQQPNYTESTRQH